MVCGEVGGWVGWAVPAWAPVAVLSAVRCDGLAGEAGPVTLVVGTSGVALLLVLCLAGWAAWTAGGYPVAGGGDAGAPHRCAPPELWPGRGKGPPLWRTLVTLGVTLHRVVLVLVDAMSSVPTARPGRS